jgi:hypothetical protein
MCYKQIDELPSLLMSNYPNVYHTLQEAKTIQESIVSQIKEITG